MLSVLKQSLIGEETKLKKLKFLKIRVNKRNLSQGYIARFQIKKPTVSINGSRGITLITTLIKVALRISGYLPNYDD